MLRLTVLIGIAGAITFASGCTWQQAYLSTQGWQRNACYRIPDQTERERCLGNTRMSYEDYRQRGDAPRKE